MQRKDEKPLRVMQVNKLYYPFIGGIENVVRELAEGLKDRTRMRVLVCNWRRKAGSLEKIHGVEVHRAGTLFMLGNLPISLSLNRMFRKLCKDNDIIQFHMPFPPADLACLCSGYKGKVIAWWHSDVVRQKRMMFFYRPFMNRFLKRCDRIIVATEEHITYSKYLTKYRDKCVVIPYGIQRDVWQESERYLEANKKKMRSVANSHRQYGRKRELMTRETVFLFVGRLVYYKGCEVLIQAFAKLIKEERCKARLIFVGSGSLDDKLHHLVVENGLQDCVSLLGRTPRKQLMRLYARCDALVLPSVARSEAFGLVQIEAMAFAKPVINTSLPSGVPRVSVHGETGLTVKPGDKDELCEAMKWMAQHEEERIAMGEKARERVATVYSAEGMLNEVMDLYRSVVQ